VFKLLLDKKYGAKITETKNYEYNELVHTVYRVYLAETFDGLYAFFEKMLEIAEPGAVKQKGYSNYDVC
jgi:hypothetical protein